MTWRNTGLGQWTGRIGGSGRDRPCLMDATVHTVVLQYEDGVLCSVCSLEAGFSSQRSRSCVREDQGTRGGITTGMGSWAS